MTPIIIEIVYTFCKESLQNLAADTGVIIKAAIKTTPTVWMPLTTLMINKSNKQKRKSLKGMPEDLVKSISNIYAIISFLNNAKTSKIMLHVHSKRKISSGNIPAALPRIYLSKPDWLPLPDCWIDVSNKIPMPKIQRE